MIEVSRERVGMGGPALVTSRPRVLVITLLFPPGMEMGAQACGQIARYLPRYGWDPLVLTVEERDLEQRDARAEPACPGPVIRTRVLPHPFMIYDRLRRRTPARLSTTDGMPPGADVSVGWREALRRWMLSLLGIPDPYSGWILPAVLAGLAAIRTHGVEHLFSSGPPWTAQLVGLILARLTGLPWTAHFRDPWTGPLSEMARIKVVSPLSVRVESWLERMVIRRADAVVCVTEEHAAALRAANPEMPADKFVTIPNGFDGGEWDDIDSDGGAPGVAEEDTFVITYAGNLYNRRSPGPVFRSLRALIDAGEIPPGRVRVKLIGWCEVAEGRRVAELAASCGLDDSVRLTGPLSRAETLRRMTRSGLLLLLAEGLSLQVPGKTYEYLRAGRPILALAPEGAVAQLLRRTGGAWVVDPADEPGMTRAIRQAYRRWRAGDDGPVTDPAVVAAFDRRLLAGRFAQVFEASARRYAARHGVRSAQPSGKDEGSAERN